MSYKVDEFTLDLRKCTAPPNYIWVNSGFSTCAPLAETVTGVAGCFSPPYSANDTVLMFEIEANGHRTPDEGNKGKDDCGVLLAGAVWRPDKIVRTGTYHYMVNKELLSLKVNSELVPLTGKAGFLVNVKVKNRSSNPVAIKIKTILKAGHPCVIPLDKWEFMPPDGSVREAIAIGKNIWENDEARVTLISSAPEKDVLCEGEICECRFAVIFTQACVAAQGDADLSVWQKETEEVWEKRIERVNETIPELKSDIPGLQDYYCRSLMSGLVCLWENDAYVVNPFPATSGIDGGSMCCYPWDLAGYGAPTFVMLLGDKTLEFLKTMLDSGIDSHTCMSLDGSGVGWCSYSYSMWSLVNLYWAIVTIRGKGLELFDDIVKLFLAEEARLDEWEHLKEYGRQHNLLEMRNCGYEYFVPSPNAERAWCYDRLADIAELSVKGDCSTWREKAEAIRNSIQINLWDEEKGWFKCIHPKGHVEYVYSIQAYDVLRMGACNESMKKDLLKHLRDGAFLGRYGISSISAEDELHYELNDPDWSGGGSYSGDSPVLAETLWEQGEDDLAWDVIGRHFWMGETLPYFPQEHYCDKPAMPANKRSNIIAGVAGLQAVLFGMAGIKPQPGGGLIIKPCPVKNGFVEIKGFRHKDIVIDILLQPQYMKINVNDELLYEGILEEVSI